MFSSRDYQLTSRKSVIRAEESFPISGQGYTVGKLADKTDCNILIDTGASQLYMSKSFYMQSRILHALPKFVTTTQRIQVGNGQYVAVLFVVPVIIEIHDQPTTWSSVDKKGWTGDTIYCIQNCIKPLWQ